MKKLSTHLALILCLVLCVFAFASCGKKNGGAGTTAAPASEPASTGTQTEATQLAHEHVPEDKYTVDLEPTCSTVGRQTIYCAECGEPIEGTTVDIPINPEAHKIPTWNVIKEATLFGEGSREGTCVICEETFVKTYSSVVERKYTTESDGTRLFVEQNIYSELLNEGEIHFYPTESNPNGNDLFVEYSFLWNDTFKNLGNVDPDTGKEHPILDTRLNTSSNDRGKGNDLTWMALRDGASNSDCPYRGGFEYGSLRTVEDGPKGMSTRTDGGSRNAYDDYPNIGGADENNPEWGWHRVGVRFGQRLTNEEAVKGGAEAEYYFFVETYIDGARVSRLSNAATTEFGASTAFNNENGDNRLFTVTADEEGNLVYEDCREGNYVTGIRLPFYNTEKDVAYVVYADYYATAGSDFVQKVTRVDSPEAAEYTTVDGVKIPAPIYYSLAD